MELWLDTADVDIIKHVKKMGILFGVTTNPSILAEVKEDPEERIREILDVQTGPVAVQVTVANADAMLQQAKRLNTISNRIIIKVPATPEGYQAMFSMYKEGIRVLATAILQSNQLILSSMVNAEYAAPYLGRMDRENINHEAELASMQKIINSQALKIKIIAAAIKTTHQVIQCAELGVQAITLPPAIFLDFLNPLPTTFSSLVKFSQDWEKSHAKSKLFMTAY